MKSQVESLRYVLLVPAVTLTVLGVAMVPDLVTRGDFDTWLMFFATGLFLPAILFGVEFRLISRIELTPHPSAAWTNSGNNHSEVLLSLPVFLGWLAWFVFGLIQSDHFVKEVAFPFGLDLLFIVTLLIFIRVRLREPSRPSEPLAQPAKDPMGLTARILVSLDQWLERGGRILWPPILLGTGSALVLAAPAISNAAWSSYLAWGHDVWITAQYGLADSIRMLKPSFNFMGHTMYIGALVLAVVSVLWMLGMGFLPSSSLLSKAKKVIAWMAGVLCTYSALDMYLGWVGFTAGEYAKTPWLWTFFGVAIFLVGAGVVLAVSAQTSRGFPQENSAVLLRSAVMLFAPIVCANAVVSSVFISLDDSSFSSLAAFYLGVQLLSWGWIEMVVPHEVSHAKNESESGSDNRGAFIRGVDVSA